MSSNPAHDERVCPNCKKTASLTCKACRAMPNATDGQLSSTWYCRLECQKAHWTEHKPQCKAAQARQTLYRAGATAQLIFFLFAKTIFMWTPGAIEKNGTLWLIHPKIHTGTSQLMPFPYNLFPDVHDQEALLTHQSCTTAVSEMHNVIKLSLRGLYSKIDEVTHYVKNAKHHMKSVYPGEGALRVDGTDYAHTIIRVTMMNGETYALDMAGAQYGWHESVTPWQLYNAARVREIKTVVPFGDTKVLYKVRANDHGKQRQRIQEIIDNFAEVVDDAVVWWQRKNISLIDLLRLPEHEFKSKRAFLLDAIEENMQRYKAFGESQGAFEVKGGFNHEGFDRNLIRAEPENI